MIRQTRVVRNKELIFTLISVSDYIAAVSFPEILLDQYTKRKNVYDSEGILIFLEHILRM